MEQSWTDFVWPIVIILFVSLLVYGGLVNWLGLPPIFAVFFAVVLVGILVVLVSMSIYAFIEDNNEKIEEINEKLDDLESLINKKLN